MGDDRVAAQVRSETIFIAGRRRGGGAMQLSLTIYTSLYMGVFCMVYNLLLANNYLFSGWYGAMGKKRKMRSGFLYVIRLLDNSTSLTWTEAAQRTNV